MFRIRNKQSLLKYASLSLFATLTLLILTPALVRAQSASADTVAVTMKNFKFVPNQLNIPTGQTVTLKFHNKGTVTHAFMAGTDVTDNLKGFNNGLFSGVHVVKTVNGKTTEKTYGSKSLMLGVKPGHTATLTFTMPESKSGNYKFGCFKSTGTGKTKHYSIGMKGTIHIGNQLSSR
ncbi:MAG TPA: cupredoxin domain-containing protein [Balneolaceae bacterium]|nr:cupredoxin domain-containing protein [Balneolaceae bacterium]